ncbi:uncharacterized protein LOC135376428 isoform X1 [Ornithodoros turicata]|uniref:uncharacterized protein LOC135376428 isoform X1 n=2 Tax=Ornithodoros turicata TaxID=34597 RepID=UPI00313A4D61
MAELQMEVFLQRVRDHRFLYDKSHPDYKDTQLKEARWALIAEEFGMKPDTCEKKWRNARDHCVKIRNKITSGMRSGMAAYQLPTVKWPHYEIVSSMLGPLPLGSNITNASSLTVPQRTTAPTPPVAQSSVASTCLARLLTAESNSQELPSPSYPSSPCIAGDVSEQTLCRPNSNGGGEDELETRLSCNEHWTQERHGEAPVSAQDKGRTSSSSTQAEMRGRTAGDLSVDGTIQRTLEACVAELNGLHRETDDVCMNHGIAIGSRLKELPRRLRSRVLHKIDEAFYEVEQELYSKDLDQ